VYILGFLTTINGHINVIKPDIPVGNGVAHIIESCITTDSDFFRDEEQSEFSTEFGAFRRKMILNRDEMKKDFI